MIAALLVQEKTSIDDVFAKLYQSSALKDSKKYILGGEATWELLNTPIKKSVIRPIFKRVRQLLFKGQSNTAKLTIPVRNFGVHSGTVVVRLESLSSALEVTNGPISISKLDKGEVVEVPFDINVKDINAESTIGLRVTIETQEGSESFVNEIPVVRDIKNEETFNKVKFVFKDSVLPLGSVRNGEILTFLSTVESYGVSQKHELFLKRIVKEGDSKKLEVTLFTRKGSEFIQIPQLIFVKDVLNLVNFIRLDLNFDGKEDYLVHALAEKDGKKYFVFSFFDENLNPLWKDFQEVKLNLDLYLESMNDLSFVALNDPILGRMLVPAFYTTGQLPKIDQNITSWDRFDSSKKNRLYYLEPNQGEFRVRSLTTKTWEDQVKQNLNSKWFETVMAEQLLPVSEADAKAGKLRVLTSVGLGAKRQLYIHTFDVSTNSHGAKIPQIVLQSDFVDPLLSLTPAGLTNDGEVYFNVYDRTRSKLVMTRGQSQLLEFVFRHESESDLIAGHIVSFESHDKHFSVLQTREELIGVITQNGKEIKRSSIPKLRYSFLSQKLLSELYFPVMYKRDEQSRAALYVDATSVTGNRIYLFEEQDGDLVASMKNSLIVPANCKALNPAFNPEQGAHEFVFICLEDKEFNLRTYSMQ